VSLTVYNGVCGLNKFAGNDFPGTVSAVLFYSGCNLRCPYCHNPDVVLGKFSQVPEFADEIETFLQNRVGIIDGIVITGGEPTIHKNLPVLTKHIRNMGYKIKLDTNGLNPKILQDCEVDYLALDIKTTPKKYVKYLDTKLSTEKVRENLLETINFIKNRGIDGELRITVAPKIIEESDFPEIAQFVAEMPVFLQNCRTKFEVLDRNFFENENFDENLAEQLKNYLEKFAKFVKIRDYGK